jgi:hypothetical protein
LTFLFTNAFGFDIYDASFAIPSVSVAAGTYWLQLQNAAASGGGSTFWDVSNGPSSAFFDSVVVPIQSESFQILGDVTTTDTVPEPGGIPLTGAAITLLYSLLRKRHLAHHGRVC